MSVPSVRRFGLNRGRCWLGTGPLAWSCLLTTQPSWNTRRRNAAGESSGGGAFDPRVSTERVRRGMHYALLIRNLVEYMSSAP